MLNVMADYSIEVSIPNQGPKGDNGGIAEAPEDATPYARKDAGWARTIALEENNSIAAVVQVRQGTLAQLQEIVLNSGEIAVELENSLPKRLRVGDGSTAGGIVPFISEWIVVQGTANDSQTTSSVDYVAINWFANIATLEPGGIYTYVGQIQILSEGEGGVKISPGGGSALKDAVVTVTEEWPYHVGSWPNDSGGDYNGATGRITFSGIVRSDNTSGHFALRFALQAPDNEGFLQFLGYSAFFAFRRIA